MLRKMMKKLLTVLIMCATVCLGATICLGATVCLGATAKTATQKPIKPATSAQLQTFVALYAKSDAAMLRGDVRYLNGILATHFTSRALSGRTSNRTQRVRNITNLFKKIKVDVSESNIERLGFREKQAFVIVLGTGEFRMRGIDGKPHRVRVVVRSTDIWISTNRGWMLQRTVENEGRQFVDGREVPAGQRV